MIKIKGRKYTRDDVIKCFEIIPFTVFYLRPSSQCILETFFKPYQFHASVIPSSSSSPVLTNAVDINRTVFVSAKLAFAHSLQPCKLYRFTFRSQKSPANLIERCVSVELLPQRNHLTDGAADVQMSEMCYFNTFSTYSKPNDTFLLTDVCAIEDSSVITADVARVAMLKSPHYSESDYSHELQEFFTIPRLLSAGDVFAVEVVNKFTAEKSRVFFKVVSLESDQNIAAHLYLVSSSQSALYQVSTVYGPIPVEHPGRFIPESLSDVANRLHSMILANDHLSLDQALNILLIGAPGSGKKLLLKYLASVINLNIVEVDGLNVWSEVAGTSEAKLKASFHRVADYGRYCIVVFTNIDVIGLDPSTDEIDCRVCAYLDECLQECRARAVVFVCERRKAEKLSSSLRALFLYEIELKDLRENDRYAVFENELQKFKNCVDFRTIARHTSGFVLAELHTVIADALYRQHETKSETLSNEHIEWAIDVRNKSFADSVGAPKIPKVTWDDVGGLTDVKQIICESLELNLKGGKGLKRSGVILYGPPGCGKTLIAKAVASQFKVTFLSVKGPELLNKYVGQSEYNVRNVFERARLAAPCVVFFDELDSLAPQRGRSGDSAGVADRIVSQLLAELDSLGDSKIFVMGATNRPDLLDPSLLTPGRFDKMIRVDVNKDAKSKENVLRAVSRNMKFTDDVDLAEIAKKCHERMSGADLYALISRATMHAIRTHVERIEGGFEKPNECGEVIVCNEDLCAALNEVKPSVSHVSAFNYEKFT